MALPQDPLPQATLARPELHQHVGLPRSCSRVDFDDSFGTLCLTACFGYSCIRRQHAGCFPRGAI